MLNNTSPLHVTLPQKMAQPGFAQGALEAINHVRDASGPCDLLPRFRRACFRLGAHSALYIQAIPDRPERWLHNALLVCEPVLSTAIRNCRSLRLHRWVRYAERQEDPIRLSELPAAELHSDDAVMLLAEHGFRSGLLVPTHGGNATGRFGLLCLGSPIEGDYDHPTSRGIQALAQALAQELNAWWLNHSRQQLRTTARLRSEDLQLLAMEREGLCSKEIARQTDSTVGSVDSRFQRINVKLGCASRKASAARCAAYGLI